jgi:hypothetical protein
MVTENTSFLLDSPRVLIPIHPVLKLKSSNRYHSKVCVCVCVFELLLLQLFLFVVKSINLNYKNTLDINYDTLKDIVTEEKKEYNMQR